MTRGPAAFAGVALMLGLASGCAMPPEESRAEPASERKVDELSEDRTAAELVEPVAALDEPPSFEQIQRELAANNAKLRKLGVLPPDDNQAAAPEGGDVTGTVTTSGSSTKGSKVGGATSVTPAPGAQPSKTGRSADKKGARRDKPNDRSASKAGGKAKDDDAAGEMFEDSPRPEPTKATPLAPNDAARGQDSAVRCQQICDLSAISCGLGDQICELAERHPEEEDYVAACERANVDCDTAKEACDVCVE